MADDTLNEKRRMARATVKSKLVKARFADTKYRDTPSRLLQRAKLMNRVNN
jgi:hypothetical protein